MAHCYRVFIASDHIKLPQSVTLDQGDSHHLRDVLRLRVGDSITAVSRTSAIEYTANIETLSPSVTIKLIEQRPESISQLSPASSIIFALCRPSANDLVCEKACELGVRQIIFWQAERSVVRIAAKEANKRIERWQRIVESAARQSGKGFTAKVSLISSLSELDTLLPKNERRLCCSLLNRAIPIQKLNPPLSSAHLLVGPSADFSASEEQLVESLGFELISLGPYRLRSETAAIAAIAMVEALSVV